MKKLFNWSVYRSISSVALIIAFALVPFGAFAASTIGTNASTTGTFLVNPATDSATSVRFQNAAGTNYFICDSTNSRVGIGAAPSTTFEVQGTASASYLMTANSLQVAGVASVAYSRFGTGATGHSLAATDDVLFTGLVEFDDNAFFDARVAIGGEPSTKFEVQGTASASYFFTTNTIQAGGTFAAAPVAYSRFRVGTTGYTSDIDAANDLLITGGLEVDGNVFFDCKASVSGNFQTAGRIRAGTASHSFTGDLNTSSNLIVGSATASSSGGAYVAEFVSTATVSVLFQGTASNKGTCLQLQNTTGNPVYARVVGTTFTVSAVSCR